MSELTRTIEDEPAHVRGSRPNDHDHTGVVTASGVVGSVLHRTDGRAPWRAAAIRGSNRSPRRRIALVGTYPPTCCGLATFTNNLRAAITSNGSDWETAVLRVLDDDEVEHAPEVVGHWLTGDAASLRRARASLATFDAVLIQHEYGLFGGTDGEEIIDLVEGLHVPLVVVLHTALLRPSPHQRLIIDRLARAATRLVVQSEVARQRILAAHGLSSERVTVIPHGATANFGEARGSAGHRPVVLTWGLLGPGKGIEHGIDALARLDLRSPAPFYVVAGRTHPKVMAACGQDYRTALQKRARSLGIADQVRFDDSYRDWDSLRALVRSADVVLLPYDSHDQVSSGVLVEAVASGKPIVATRFPHAVELLSNGAGLLVGQGDTEAMAAALRRTLYEPGLAATMSAAARQAARPLLWPAVGKAYRHMADEVIRQVAMS